MTDTIVNRAAAAGCVLTGRTAGLRASAQVAALQCLEESGSQRISRLPVAAGVGRQGLGLIQPRQVRRLWRLVKVSA